jgi:hypothetical protein
MNPGPGPVAREPLAQPEHHGQLRAAVIQAVHPYIGAA